MALSCRRRIRARWCKETRCNAWVRLSDAGWRKLDDRSDDARTCLLALAAHTKRLEARVRVDPDLRPGALDLHLPRLGPPDGGIMPRCGAVGGVP
jgi:hypothetical protein